jgi:hypothetical protein
MIFKATIHFTRPNNQPDDILYIHQMDVPNIYHLIFKPKEYVRARNEFYMNTNDLLMYIRNLLSTLEHDTEPYENVQLTTAIHPAILFHVSDMDKFEVRDKFESLLKTALRTFVKRTVIPARPVSPPCLP